MFKKIRLDGLRGPSSEKRRRYAVLMMVKIISEVHTSDYNLAKNTVIMRMAEFVPLKMFDVIEKETIEFIKSRKGGGE